MKTLRAAVALILCGFLVQSLAAQNTQVIVGRRRAASGGVTWTLYQNPSNFTCGSTAASATFNCAVTLTHNTVAGDLLIYLGAAWESVANPTSIALTGMSGDGTWTHCPSANANKIGGSSGVSIQSTDCYYRLVATGGASTITGTFTVSNSVDPNCSASGSGAGCVADGVVLEYTRSSGSASYDTDGTSTAGSCTSCVGPSLSLSGASDVIAQWNSNESICTSISGASYTNPSAMVDNMNTYGTFAGAINQSSSSAQTWTCSSGDAAMSAVSFK